MASRILTEFKQQISSLTLQPSSGGCFEVSINDQLVYSKNKTGQFPEDPAIEAEVRKRL